MKTELIFLFCFVSINVNSECNEPGLSPGLVPYHFDKNSTVAGKQWEERSFECEQPGNGTVRHAVSLIKLPFGTKNASSFCYNGMWIPSSIVCVAQIDEPKIVSIELKYGRVKVDYEHDGKTECLNIMHNTTEMVIKLSRRLLIKTVSIYYETSSNLNRISYLSLGWRRPCVQITPDQDSILVSDPHSFYEARGMIAN